MEDRLLSHLHFCTDAVLLLKTVVNLGHFQPVPAAYYIPCLPEVLQHCSCAKKKKKITSHQEHSAKAQPVVHLQGEPFFNGEMH